MSGNTRRWWKESVVYQIYPRSFNDSNQDGIGDIPGITEKLDYLKKLGVDVIWLSPVYDSPNDDNGYDIRSYSKIMDEFGTMEDWEMLLQEMHKRGLKLVMDLVVNHTSDEHAWFAESRSSDDNPYRDYYIWREGKQDAPPNNWESNFSGSAWEYDEKTGEYYLHLFSKKQPDLNWENESLRKDVYSMMNMWLDKGVDGFRMDVINFLSKEPGLPDNPDAAPGQLASGAEFFMNGPRMHEFLQEMHEEVMAGRDIMTVGEMPGVDEVQAVDYTAEERRELNMVFQFEHVDLDSGPEGKWDLLPFNMPTLRENLSKWQYALMDKGWNSLYLNNHDQPRLVSRFGDDQTYWFQSASMLAIMLHMMRGTPYIYQGEELGMTNVRFDSIEAYEDIETLNMYQEKRAAGVSHEALMEKIYVKGRDNARTPMQWDDTTNAGFTEGTPWLAVNPNYSRINAAKALADPDSLFYVYQKLIQLRKEYDVIVYGDFELIHKESDTIFAYKRCLDDHQLTVFCSFSDQESEPVDTGEGTILISNYKRDAGGRITLQPYEAVVVLSHRS
ncbi:glycoside hydrolase family 13 protein [Alkalicoccus luteus]|uniref:oligo-1,6-glucosidase n=1 Tax=Alkalicoccus luteus TaxID=1237094 RepID=A0A969PNI1_9BACI|nr:alpha-glucosidase [Alkalicoccus luteus]NJP36538.1 alpha-glucosidase [Alkalicoccus luteus]